MAILGNLNFLELALILIVAIMIFGRDLPRVAGQLFAHLSKAKRTMQTMWRETGIDAEMRKVQREMREAEALARFDPAAIAREATDRWTKDIDVVADEDSSKEQDSVDPDAWRASDGGAAPGDPGETAKADTDTDPQTDSAVEAEEGDQKSA